MCHDSNSVAHIEVTKSVFAELACLQYVEYDTHDFQLLTLSVYVCIQVCVCAHVCAHMHTCTTKLNAQTVCYRSWDNGSQVCMY